VQPEEALVEGLHPVELAAARISWRVSPPVSGSRMRSATRPVLTSTSTAGTRPAPSARSSRRWLTIPRSEVARLSLTWRCCDDGKKSTIRFTVSTVSAVWSVDRTRWPVSAAERAARTVWASRISPMKMTSGSWRSTRRMASENPPVSVPISRWFTMARRSSNTNSIGSSMVTMFTARVRLTWSIIAAAVVVLPDPVGPVTSTRPLTSLARTSTTGGTPSWSKPGTSDGTLRRTMAIVPRWR
jgi:hypothetical protein